MRKKITRVIRRNKKVPKRSKRDYEIWEEDEGTAWGTAQVAKWRMRYWNRKGTWIYSSGGGHYMLLTHTLLVV